jgi:hypothetical protein
MAREKLKKSLKEKGWTQEEVDKAMQIMEATHPEIKHVETRTQITSHFNVFVYWTALIVAMIGNIMLAVILVPLMLYLSSGILYFVIAVIALTFGILFNALVNSIEEVDYKHHIVAGVFIPAIAILNVYIMIRFSNAVNATYTLTEQAHSPVIIGTLYVGFFVLPYLFTKIKENIILVKKPE